MRFLPLLFFIFLTIALALSLLHKRQSQNAPSWIGKAMPELEVTRLEDSTPLTLTSSKHFTLINLFASWCAPCIAEMPLLKTMGKSGNIKIIGIAWNDSKKAIDQLFTTESNPYDALYIDNSGKTAIALGMRGVPESFLIDDKGFIRFHSAGPITQAHWQNDITPIVRPHKPASISESGARHEK